MDRVISEVRVTDNYELFELMPGNRNDANARSKKIEESVKQAGRYIHAPIIVTDKDKDTGRYPIVDGQARYTYCKNTNTPIAYCVIPGLTINDCIAMNASTSNWKLLDYIKSYAERGIDSYVKATEFIAESPYSLAITLWALLHTEERNSTETIKTGRLNVTQNMVDDGKALIEYWGRFDDIFTNRRKELLIAIGYCYMMKPVDNEMLVRKLHQRPRAFQSIACVTDAIDVIEDCYNMRQREHVYIETEYFKAIDEKASGVAKILSDRKDARRERMGLEG